MGKTAVSVLAAFLTAGLGTLAASAGPAQDQAQAAAPAISWDNWRAAKASAEKYDNEGNFKAAYEAYLEYTRQAQGLARPDLVAWGKNDAAYMLIKMHKEDASVDLTKAKTLLDEGLAIEGAGQECLDRLRSNLAYVEYALSQKSP
jgi:hypothetical protein